MLSNAWRRKILPSNPSRHLKRLVDEVEALSGIIIMMILSWLQINHFYLEHKKYLIALISSRYSVVVVSERLTFLNKRGK